MTQYYAMTLIQVSQQNRESTEGFLKCIVDKIKKGYLDEATVHIM